MVLNIDRKWCILLTMGKVLSVVNQKGGVGKTTTVFHLGIALSKEFKILMVDLDPQGGLTLMSTGKDPDEYENTIADVMLEEELEIEEAILTITKTLSLIPANIQLSLVEALIINAFQREFILRRNLNKIRDKYDLIIIDTPPSLGLLTINALLASNSIIVPVESRFMGFRGLSILYRLLNKLEKAVEGFSTQNYILGILPTFHSRTVLSREIVDEIRDRLKVKIFDPVTETIRVAETPVFKTPVFEREKENPASIAYTKLAEEVKEWLKSS